MCQLIDPSIFIIEKIEVTCNLFSFKTGVAPKLVPVTSIDENFFVGLLFIVLKTEVICYFSVDRHLCTNQIRA